MSKPAPGSPEVVGFGPHAARWTLVSAMVGVLALGLGAYLACIGEQALRTFSLAYLTSFIFFLSISLGALFFVMLQHLTRAGWSVVVRRIAELLAANLALLAVLSLALIVPVLLGRGELYPWAAAVGQHTEARAQAQAGYLNGPFFSLRLAIYFAVWVVLARFYLNRSVEQDRTGDALATTKMQKWSGLGMVVFALSVTLAAFDLVMSLDPAWSSTVFGVYLFAGCAVAFFAVLALSMAGLDGRASFGRLLTAEHYHDVGKLLFAFIFFWGYIAFSQFLLIWYANLPDETHWYRVRLEGAWLAVTVVLLFSHLLVPFAGLLSRSAKRKKAVLAFWASWMLVAHYLDLYWLIAPTGGAAPHFGSIDILCFVGILGLYVAFVLALGRARSLVAWRDPRLAEAIAFENV